MANSEATKVAVAISATLVGGVLTMLVASGVIAKSTADSALFVLSGAILVSISFIAWRSRAKREEKAEKKIEAIEERARENPEKPQLAWDLARVKLESYLDRNLSQVRSIFWLTLGVMAIGFAFVLFGLLKAYDNPDNLSTVYVSIVSAASGVIISFIGGSFLVVYRSILAQAQDYVSVLERINAVGMAIQVLGTISDDAKELRNDSTALLAKQLVSLYSKADARLELGPEKQKR
jgi:hypothetical protein